MFVDLFFEVMLDLTGYSRTNSYIIASDNSKIIVKQYLTSTN